MKKYLHFLLFSFSSILWFQAAANQETCSTAKYLEVVAPATADRNSVEVSCNLILKSSDIVTKQVRISGGNASNLTLNCNGASLVSNQFSDPHLRLLVRSLRSTTSDGIEVWSRPENVSIKKCIIYGSTRVQGMGSNGQGKYLTESSKNNGHTARVQKNAPRGIHFSLMKFLGQGKTPVYFSPGVNHSSILKSHIGGFADSVAIYFDAESASNTVDGNTINTTTLERETNGKHSNARELFAIDGSAHNRIINNYFSRLNHGGIYLYRNCGEGGNIRHQTPSFNVIENNTFYYKKYKGELPSVWVASRKGRSSYCDADKGYPFGSSRSDLDHAKNNIIRFNLIYKLSPSQMIRVDSHPNSVDSNKTVFE
jgi:hypothetical protein